jgi:hypothetical protein
LCFGDGEEDGWDLEDIVEIFFSAGSVFELQEILRKGEVQVGERERKDILERVEKEVLDIVSGLYGGSLAGFPPEGYRFRRLLLALLTEQFVLWRRTFISNQARSALNSPVTKTNCSNTDPALKKISTMSYLRRKRTLL